MIDLYLICYSTHHTPNSIKRQKMVFSRVNGCLYLTRINWMISFYQYRLAFKILCVNLYTHFVMKRNFNLYRLALDLLSVKLYSFGTKVSFSQVRQSLINIQNDFHSPHFINLRSTASRYNPMMSSTKLTLMLREE